MSNKTEQIHATQAIAAIKEQIQLEQWQKDIADRQTTGRSITAFCEEQGISKSTYYYRLRKVREYIPVNSKEADIVGFFAVYLRILFSIS
jgi:hypothetical protein